jgi:hypothetical protein
MDEVFERLKSLDGQPVWVALLRAKDQTGVPVYRSGTFRLFSQPAGAEEPVTRIVDADDLPVVTFLGPDMFSLAGGALRAQFRTSFRVDVADRAFPPPASAHTSAGRVADGLSFEGAMRELVAELEAGFRTALIMRPDPDPEASLRARYHVPPTEEGPLPDWSMRFAVGHNSATIRPHDDGIVRLTSIGSSLRGGRQVIDLFEPTHGPLYKLIRSDIERLAVDVRRFLSNRREFYLPLSSSRA